MVKLAVDAELKIAFQDCFTLVSWKSYISESESGSGDYRHVILPVPGEGASADRWDPKIWYSMMLVFEEFQEDALIRVRQNGGDFPDGSVVRKCT